MGRYKQESVYVLEVTMVALLFFVVADCRPHNGRRLTTILPAVKLEIQPKQVTMSNDLAKVTLSIPEGHVIGISYGGVQNLLATQNVHRNRGFLGTNFEVIIDNENQTEISFKRTWNVSQSSEPPLNIDKRFIMLRDTPGFYTYTIVERLEGWPASYIQSLRVVFKLQPDIFHYMAVSDERQRVMPTEVDRNNGEVLDYKEAVLLTDPINPDLKGEVDDKYFYASDDKDGKVYGWVSNTNPSLGFWMINPSNEYRTGGPLKQDLTTHTGPIILSVFVSAHYAGEDLAIKFQQGETWKKVIGPVFVYLNSDAAAVANPSILWNDAKERGYQFWNKTDSNGNFIIENVIFGTYNLYATVPGIIGDYKYASDIKVTPGTLVYKPPRNGATIWEIGVPDRTAYEFFIPSPPSQFKVHKYKNNSESIFRQYGLWEQYSVLYPENDLVYDVKTDNYSRDWFFAQVTRNLGNNTYKATTWKIIFSLANVENASNYTLQLALAAAHQAELHVRVNDEKAQEPHFKTGYIGGSNVIARHGIHGLYWLYSIGIQGNLLVKGTNTIFLAQTRDLTPFQGQNMGKNMQLSLYSMEFTMVAFTFLLVADGRRLTETPSVKLDIQTEQVTMSNGITNVTLSIPDGLVTNISYGGINNLLSTQNVGNNRGYWDVFWNSTTSKRARKKFLRNSFEVIMDCENQTEVSFKSTWNASESDELPLNSDIRFVMLRDTPGFYTYAIFERLEGWPLVYIENLRVVFKLQQDMFHYMAISDERQRIMPMPADRDTGKVLDYKEAVLLTDPTNPDLKGEVDDKYFYANDNKDDRVHGWAGANPPVGFWMIIPSDEFRTGGPYRQDLTTHVGPTVLSVFVSRHYAGEDLVIKFQQGEPWKKVIGPVFLYLNSNSSAKDNPVVLWDDAKKRMNQEVASWPYDFPVSKDYFKSNQRGTVRGQLFVNDSTTTLVPASNGYIGLAPPGDVGSWQRENKGYQFWTRADAWGNFTIENVISGTYNLYATVPGIIGDYKYTSEVQVTPGSSIELGSLVYNPPRNGATLWEIGVPDRTAAEFFIPTPPPQFKVHVYQNNSESIFRQYGLWEQYSVLYPENDLVYYVGTSNYSKDWFFAHVTRNIGNKNYEATTWKIVFNLETVGNAANYTLQLALAAAQRAELQVRFNDGKLAVPHFTTGKIGGDNAIARHGIHGLYFLYSIEVQGNLLVNGTNTIFLTQAIATSPFQGVMYDYLRLEGPHR
ncbi:hypothetical protein HAX54_033732 [Datura stramonium]|uniref:rhamnogalacturonan endolyase n=1 Tax=Datura stramonium TaxID=4076 RepID=A0ABS8SDK1_DATST|nr:hypothetical protein [Datura stramonium]